MIPKRVLTICFLLLALAGNAAWAAADYHAIPDSTIAVDQDSDHQNLPNGQYDGCDDHCCHAGAHLLGLLGSPSAWSFTPSSDSYRTSDQQPPSHTLSPLFQPPIA